jgi:hypothetical protein
MHRALEQTARRLGGRFCHVTVAAEVQASECGHPGNGQGLRTSLARSHQAVTLPPVGARLRTPVRLCSSIPSSARRRWSGTAPMACWVDRDGHRHDATLGASSANCGVTAPEATRTCQARAAGQMGYAMITVTEAGCCMLLATASRVPVP